MRYVFLIYANEETVNALPAEDRRAIFTAHLALHRSLALARRFPAGPGHHVEIRPAPEV